MHSSDNRTYVERVWPNSAHAEVHQLAGSSPHSSPAWSPGGSWLRVKDGPAHGSGTLRFWSPAGTQHDLDMDAFPDVLRWFPTGDAVVARWPSSIMKGLTVIDLRGASAVMRDVPGSSVLCAVSGDGRHLAYSDGSQRVQVAELDSAAPGMPITDEIDSGVGLGPCAASPDGRWVAVLDAGQVHAIPAEELETADIPTTAPARECERVDRTLSWAPSHAVLVTRRVRVTEDGCSLCEYEACPRTSDLHLLDLRQGTPPASQKLMEGTDAVHARALDWETSDEGRPRLLVVAPSAHDTPLLQLLELRDDFVTLGSLELPAGGRVVAANLSGDGERFVYYVESDGGVRIHAVTTTDWEPLAIGSYPPTYGQYGERCRWSPDSHHAICTFLPDGLQSTAAGEIWSVSFTGPVPRRVRIDDVAGVRPADFSRDGRMLAYHRLKTDVPLGDEQLVVVPYGDEGPELEERFTVAEAGQLTRFAWRP